MHSIVKDYSSKLDLPKALNSENCLIWQTAITLLKRAAFSKCDPFVCMEFHSGPKDLAVINKNLKVFTVDMEDPLPHKYRS